VEWAVGAGWEHPGSEEPGEVRIRGGPGGRGSEELRRRVPSGWVCRSEDRRACLDGGVHSSGRGVPAGPGQVAVAPKRRGEMPGITGVRARRLGTGCEEEIPMR
jgi:hypothetical protein